MAKRVRTEAGPGGPLVLALATKCVHPVCKGCGGQGVRADDGTTEPPTGQVPAPGAGGGAAHGRGTDEAAAGTAEDGQARRPHGAGEGDGGAGVAAGQGHVCLPRPGDAAVPGGCDNG